LAAARDWGFAFAPRGKRLCPFGYAPVLLVCFFAEHSGQSFLCPMRREKAFF